MKSVNPTKQQIREYMEQRRAANTPPPTTAEIRQRLGWNLLPNNRPNNDG